MRIGVVSFNENEAFAVDSLLSDLVSGAPSPWRREGPQAIARDYGTDTWRLEHFSLLAQGNVVAAAALAASSRRRNRSSISSSSMAARVRSNHSTSAKSSSSNAPITSPWEGWRRSQRKAMGKTVSW